MQMKHSYFRSCLNEYYLCEIHEFDQSGKSVKISFVDRRGFYNNDYFWVPQNVIEIF